ncbi:MULTISPECIES: aromatic ring-hydroxylating dioxygenase subunit alpha [unclassified Beijerinckia]|uniref:aromatic ring-hydroxylating dioxygenase subunit alpha n=1 Tax=unclassified Beijerinckia TaxID=2638183 RepID=UPI000894C7F7|nr:MULTISPECIES: aromatic ring-hydroxylating dioxygenase subunit alpha [unclassified Beijerinckia]MDH7799619.1 phenylpropionate dioxygenase-like ring-hydroxylating dioxygenase large terminal subunit [Beijerinckia sp. GAS462]SEB47924.1 vanillate O-demethylase monooxygenase subunit [Beijerinckia sp. 28-YEA-48]
MYPFNSDRAYIRNAWYVAAWGSEITRKPFQRTIMEEPIVFYRTESGEPVAMFGLCPHRTHPLVDGRLIGDDIMCPYHGFTYSPQGACVRIPAQDKVPQQFRQRIYPLVERGGAVWIWMGDASAVDMTKMPQISEIGMDVPGWKTVENGMTSIKARWSLVIDNVMDLSHVGFIHLKTIEAPAAGEVAPQDDADQRIQCARWLINQSPDMSYARNAIPDNSEPLDLELGSVFYGPGLVAAYLRFYTAASKGERKLLSTTYHLQCVTPETPHMSYNFSGVVRNVRLDAPDFDQWLKTAVNKTREEDVEALEKIEPMVDRFANARSELSGVGDVSAIRVRRQLAALLALEEAA